MANTTTGDIPAEERCITFTPTSDTYQLIFFLNGDIYNINWWDIDDVTIDYLVPVEVTSFTASPLHDEVELKWATATETNNRGFEIERMSTGGQFEKIGFVAGYGTTTEPKAYSFVDTKLETGKYTYRLKQIDLDGTYKYSKEVDVDVEFAVLVPCKINVFKTGIFCNHGISTNGTSILISLLFAKSATVPPSVHLTPCISPENLIRAWSRF